MTRKTWFQILAGAAAATGIVWAASLHASVKPDAVAACGGDATTLCLNNSRFTVRVTFTTPQGQSGSGQAVPLTTDTGYFWFFSANNVEMVVKVVDGRAVNNRFWVFAGGLTNVNVVMTVTDTATGAAKVYTNPQGAAFQPIQDTSAFAATAPEDRGNVPVGPQPTEASERSGERPRAEGAQAACAPDVNTLCLNSGRFKIQTAWQTTNGQSGLAQGVALTGDTGYFWFFSSSNVEMVVKVLDACSFNSRFWVFAGGLTDVNVVMTVTDTQTGASKSYTNPQGVAFQPIQDTNAFSGCAAPNACSPPNRCLGPAPGAFPALVDTNGNGRPDPGVDLALFPVYNATNQTLYVDNPWDNCRFPGYHTVLSLTNPQAGTGIMTRGTAVNGDGDTYQYDASAFTANNEPKSFALTISVPNFLLWNWSLTLLDLNGSGFFNGGNGTRTFDFRGGGTVSVQLQFVYFDVNGDGIPDYVSIPWSQAAALGVKLSDSTCGPSGAGGRHPQIFLPLANRRVVLDLNGDGSPDSGFFQSPIIAPAAITGSSNASKKVPVGAALGLIALAFLKLRRGGIGF